MASKKGESSSRAQPQPHSGLLNKTGMAVLMGLVGLGLVIGVRFVVPALVPFALVLMGVGVVSAFVTVGKTYAGVCPHCGKKIVYKHAYGARSFRCRLCKSRVALRRQGDRLDFEKA